MGFNSNSTSINITLVEDIQNKRKPNAIDEGYHIWDKDKGFPEGASLNYPSGGDILYAPIVGEPAYFSYYKAKIRNCGECLEITRPSSPKQGMEFVSHTDTCSDESRLTKDTCEETDPSTGAGYGTWRDINDEASCIAAVAAGSGVLQWTVPSGEDKEKQEYDSILEKVFEFNGILKSYKRNSNSSGITYEISLEDPRMMLEGSQVILNGYAGSTAPADRSFGMIQEFDDGKLDNERTLSNGYQGYYNIINAYGYYEYYNFGGADVNKNGFSWRKILIACQAILQGKYDIHRGADLDRMGGPLYYVRDSRDHQLIKATAPVNVHRYKVDLSEMDNLSDANGGLLPDIYRIKGEKMSLLSLIQNICETAGADFFVELLKTEAKKKKDPDREYSGIIKITPIPRTAVITPGKIQTEIDTAVGQHACGTTAAHQWANRIISHNMGYEFKDPVSGIMMVGDKRTRVVGVSAMGWFPNINAGMIRERFFSRNEKLKEFFPSTDHDGVTYANPGWYHPHDMPYKRGFSYDQAGLSMIPGNMPNSPTPASNDDYLAWGKSNVPDMHIRIGGLDSLSGAVAANIVSNPTFMPQGTYGDGMLDIFPCWGFIKGADRFQGPFGAVNLLQEKAEGVPIMGGFADDSPYNDFDTIDGIFSTFEYYNPQTTLNGVNYCAQNPYSENCYRTPMDPRYAKTYRYKLHNVRWVTSEYFVDEPVVGAIPPMSRPVQYFYEQMYWSWHIPKVNVIPVNLAGTGWNGGPTTSNGDYGHYYYTTVTALRAALEGYDSWLEYTIIFEPWLHCTMGVDTCPLRGGLQNNVDISGGTVTVKMMKKYGIPGPRNVVNAAGVDNMIEVAIPPLIPVGDPRCAGVNPAPGCEGTPVLRDGKAQYWPAMTQHNGIKAHSFNRWLGEGFTDVRSEGMENVGDDGRMQDIMGTADPLTGKAKVVVPGTTIEDTLTEVFNRVNKVASEFYGKKYLVPLPFTPAEVGQHLRKVSDGGYDFESSWEPTSNGWVDIDTRSPDIGKRYPNNINFFDNSGKLGGFVVYPLAYRKTISKEQDWIHFPSAGGPSSLDPESFHVTSLAKNNSMGGGSEGKVFAKSQADKQVYWLWNPTTYQIQTGKATTGTLKPYALVTINSPATYWPKSFDISRGVQTGSTMAPGSVGQNGAPGNAFWKFWFDNIQGPASHGFPAAYSSHSYNSIITVPLGRVDDGRALFWGDGNHVQGWGYMIGDSEGEAGGRFSLHPAMFKPWTAAVPMVSNRYRWGPWAEGKGFGKSELIIDKSFAPENFGGFDNMEYAAIAKIQAATETTNPQSGWAIESGSISLAGLPSTDDVDNPRIMGLQLMGAGPYVTDVNVTIGTDGVTTTYNMKTQRKKHKLNEIYENRMRQNTEDLLQYYQDTANYVTSQNEL
jgi:hypothetical protein